MKQSQRNILSLPAKAPSPVDLTPLDVNKLDAAIWNLMSDFKKRSASEIRQAIVMEGFPLQLIDRRLDAIFAKKWFDRNGERGNDVKYTLKKHIKNPLKEATVETPKPQLQPTIGTMLKGSIAATLSAGYETPESVSAESYQPATSPMPLLDVPCEAPHAALPEVPTVTPLTENVINLTVDPTDHVRLALWKVMHDRQQYTVAELSTLLEHIPVGTITYHLRQMRGSMVNVVKVAGSNAHAYILREGVPMPEGLPSYQPNFQIEAKEVSQPQQQELVTAETTTQPEEPVMTTQPAPLFSMTITIRDQQFTMKDLRQIADEMDEVMPYLQAPKAMLGFKITIRGMEFTLEEASQLYQQLQEI